MKINHEFTATGLRVESARDSSKITMDDLFWCFETNIHFYESHFSDVALTIQEASLFSFRDDFVKVMRLLPREAVCRFNIEDLDGAYTLSIERDGDVVTLIINPRYQRMSVPLQEFLDASFIWFREAIESVEQVFPKLQQNPYFLQIKKSTYTEFSGTSSRIH